MPNYIYKARDKYGKLISNIMAAESQDAVAAKIKESGYMLVSVVENKGGSGGSFMDRFKKVSVVELSMLTKQLAVLEKAGVPLITALKSLKEQGDNGLLSDALTNIVKDIEGGESLSVAMSKYPKIFDQLYVNLVMAGETGGVLTESLERLAALLESQERMRTRITAAVRYPIMVVIAMIVGLLLLVAFVVPAFAKMYEGAANLPLPTQILLGIHYVLTKFWWLMIIVVVAGAIIFKKVISTKAGRYLWDKFLLKVPIFGPLMLKITISRFARLTSLLMRSAVPILKVLDLASASVGNVIVEDIIQKIKESVNKGEGMIAPMKESKLFPPAVIQMISVGEDTGKTDELLLHVANYYDSQIDYTVDNLTSLIEPMLLVFMGGGVLLMMLGIFLPMWNMGKLMIKS